jgi:hypothetical protein
LIPEVNIIKPINVKSTVLSLVIIMATDLGYIIKKEAFSLFLQKDKDEGV